jgi:aminopeptidase N
MRFIQAGIFTLLAAALCAAPASAATPGEAGLGDRLFPTLGNGGYDAKHYDLGLYYGSTAPEQDVRGLVRMRAVATKDLSRFNLDYAGDTVHSVQVDGRTASFKRDKRELVITPARVLRAGRSFDVVVTFTGGPYTPEEGDFGPIGWFTTRDGSVTSGQINRAQDIYPVNDHPSDKATYSYTIAAPKETTVAVSGRRTGKRAVGDSYVWSFEMDEPMASQVIQVATGDLVEVERGRVGSTRLRDVVARRYVETTNPTLSEGPAQFRWMLGHTGAYPFDEYGVLAIDYSMRYALETQTLTLHPAELFDPAEYPQDFAQSIAVHELAHQWFGDSVAIASYSDLWLAEGPATWYEQEFLADFFEGDFEAFMRDEYAVSQQYRDEFGPVARPKNGSDEVIFSDQIYGGGALALFALHEKVGDRTWRALMKEWVQRYEGRSVSTDDFIAFVDRHVRGDMTRFLRDWLYGTTTPPMPGHPDWETAGAPVATATAARASRATSAARLERFGR